MAIYSSKQLQQFKDLLGADFGTRIPNWNSRYWEGFNTGAAGQRNFLRLLNPEDVAKVLRAALQIAKYQPPEDIYKQRLHDAIIEHYAETPDTLPALNTWTRAITTKLASRNNTPQSVEQLTKTKKGTVNAAARQLYRTLRGLGKLNEAKDFISNAEAAGIFSNPGSSLLRALAIRGHVQYDPRSGVILVPRNVIRVMDPYYETYNKTLEAFKERVGNGLIPLFQGDDGMSDEVMAQGKAWIQQQMRQDFPRIPEDTPVEERDRILAEQQAALENISDAEIGAGVAQIRNHLENLVYDQEQLGHFASLFTEKGLRNLMNSPKAAMKIAQIAEVLTDKWHDIQTSGTTHRVHDPVIGHNEGYEALPEVVQPAGPWQSTELDSVNSFSKMLQDMQAAQERQTQQQARAQALIAAYHAAHPEAVAAYNAAHAAEQARWDAEYSRNFTSPYVRTAEDAEEDKLLERVPGHGGYGNRASAILKNPRLVELGNRPYQYSKDVLQTVDSFSPIESRGPDHWTLAKNRTDLYNRSMEHDICVGMPRMGYDTDIKDRKTLIFFNGDHADPESATAEIRLQLDKDGTIKKATITQVHTRANARYTGDTQNLKDIAAELVGKNVLDTNNVVNAEGIEYKESTDQNVQLPQEPQQVMPEDGNALYDRLVVGAGGDNITDEALDEVNERMINQHGARQDDDGNWLLPNDPRYNDIEEDADFDNDEEEEEEDPGYVEGGYVENLGNRQFERFLTQLIDEGTKPVHKAVLSVVSRRF